MTMTGVFHYITSKCLLKTNTETKSTSLGDPVAPYTQFDKKWLGLTALSSLKLYTFSLGSKKRL